MRNAEIEWRSKKKENPKWVTTIEWKHWTRNVGGINKKFLLYVFDKLVDKNKQKKHKK